MTTLRRFLICLALTTVLAMSALAGETSGPPCAPGETGAPPCSGQSVTDGPTDPGETNGPPSSAFDLTTIVDGVQLALSLF